MSSAFSQVLSELNLFVQPLRLAATGGEATDDFLARIGRDSTGSTVATAAFGSLSAALNSIAAAIADGGGGQAQALEAGGQALFQALHNATGQLAGLGVGQEFFAECFDLLLYDYLGARAPTLAAALAAAGALQTEVVYPGQPNGRALAYKRISFRWAVLKDLVSNTDAWARDVYGWGTTAFVYARAFERIAGIVDGLGRSSYFRPMTTAELAIFVLGQDDDTPTIASFYPLISRDVSLLGGAKANAEAGLLLSPVGDLTNPQSLGIALSPYTTAAVNQKFQLSPLFTLDVVASGDATLGAAIVLSPGSSPYLKGVAGAGADFEFGFIAKPASGPLHLVGGDAGSRVEAEAFHATVGGHLDSSPDIFVAAGLQNLKVIIDPSEDGFLGKIIRNPLEIEAGDILMGWRPDRGVYFESGTSLEVTVPVERNLGPVDLHSITVGLDWKTDLKISAAVTADAQLGPLYAYVKGLGVEVVVKEDSGGALGKYDLDFKLKKPTGYAVALDASPIVGGGYLDVLDHEYRGALALKLKTIGFSAFAILDTELPGGAKGFSFIASIFGEFTIPIGQGFFLTGLGGFIGINRTVDSEALRDVLFQGELGDLLFPPDPIAAAPQILANMAAIFPAKDGQYLFGPAARIEFSKPPLVTGKIAVILEMGGETRLLILGALYAQLPNPNSPIVDLRLAFMGVVDFAAQTIAIDATLQGSKILTFPVSGDVAIRTGWSGHADQLMFFGGCHPEYASPVGVPSLRRLSISFGSNNPRITLTSYQALTLNSLQFGAHADLYAQGPRIEVLKIGWDLAAEGHAYFDALIYFNPFSFDIALGADLSLLVNGKVKASLGFDLRLSGPNEFVIHGHVWVTVCKVDIDFALDHAWGSKQSETPAIASPASLVWAAFSQHATLEPVAPVGLSEGVVFAKADAASAQDKPLNPMGGARLSQRAAPLGIDVEKIGEARVVSGDTKVDLKLSHSAGPVATDPLNLEFVRGHFWPLSGGDRLRAPAFENHKAGLEIAADASLTIAADKACGGDLSYETIELGVDSSTPAVLSDMPFVHYQAVKAELIASYTASIATPLAGIAVAAADAVSVQDVGFVLGSLDAGGGVRADVSGVLEPTFSQALAAASAAQTGLRPVNPAIAAYFTEGG